MSKKDETGKAIDSKKAIKREELGWERDRGKGSK
jgi:hypothetical protein